MSSVLDQFWEVVGWVLALKGEAFVVIGSRLNGLWFSLVMVFLAGLSLAIGQGVILFLNKVKPLRFVISLLLNAVLFAFGFLALALSTWLICLLPNSVHVPLTSLMTALGLGYVPLLFSFLGALPYLGYPILNLLSVWNFLAIVVGFGAIAQVGLAGAFSYVALGWVIKQLLENTIGQPIAQLGGRLADRVAGVELADSRRELQELIQSRIKPVEAIEASVGAMSTAPQIPNPTQPAVPATAQAIAQTLVEQPQAPTVINITEGTDLRDPLVLLKQSLRNFPQIGKLVLSLVAMAIAFVIILILLDPIRNWWFGWYSGLPVPLRLVADLVWMGVVAFVFAGMLAPLEALGWWAGWYGDDLNTAAAPKRPSAIAADSDQPADPVSRYVVYLDGIGQSGDDYTPDVEEFLAALEPALPSDMALVRGLMMYSVLNKPLDEDRPLAFLWRRADKARWTNPTALLGIIVNLRNVLIVAVSSDKRYGPIYNQGIAQVIFDGLIQRGYQPGSGVPITLIGYSGGGEMSIAAGPYLKRAIGAPIDVISVGGVMSANNNILKLEHLYHVVGEKDSVERLGPIMFPGRWKLFSLSYWNRAKRKGKITVMSAGPVGHQVPGGYMDPNATLPNGRTNLQQTIEIILTILRGDALRADAMIPRQMGNYTKYLQSVDFIRPDYYPLHQTCDRPLYQPLGNWMGRLILPAATDRRRVRGVYFEVHYTPEPYRHLRGQVVTLRWANDPIVQRLVKAVTKDLHFSADAEYSSRFAGLVLPDRLNHWRQVDPLESLAGAHPVDDITVLLNDPVQVNRDTLYIRSTPVQITGRFYALVKFDAPIAGTDQFYVTHFNTASRQFNGPTEVMRLPSVMLAEAYGSYPSTTRELEKSPFNETGWYVYGARDAQGLFVVQALGPRSLFRLQPDEVIFGRRAAQNYIRKRAWKDIVAQKGRITSVLCAGRSSDSSEAIQTAINQWQEGDRALILHTYGGIGGIKKEPAASTPIFFGHFAYGVARVIREPITSELQFDLRYYQVYTQNTDGLVAGTLHWSRYLGDRQLGWVGTRPICDILVKLDAFTTDYTVNGRNLSPLQIMLRQLQVMTARYRIGDGTGSTYVGPANNCSQDSNQALFASIMTAAQYIRENPQLMDDLMAVNPEQGDRFQNLQQLGKELHHKLQPLGSPRADWQHNEFNLGSTLEDNPLRNLWTGLGSWRTMLPRLASDTIVRIFLAHGASVWVLRTNQIGGYDPEIEPIAPMTL